MSSQGIDSTVTTSSPGIFDKVRSDFSALRADLNSGNLSGAQQDFSTLMTDDPGLQSNLQGSAATAFGSLSTSLQSGDLTGAQTAFTNLSQAMHTHAHGHHHHHCADSDGDSDDNASASGSGLSQLLNQPQADFNTLATAVQNGNLTAAQAAFAQLKLDDPAVVSALAQTGTSNPTYSALNSLQSALNSGDLAGAQTAINALDGVSS